MKYELTPRQVEVARFALYMFARNARLRADAAAQKSSEEPFSNVAAFLKDAADAEELIGHLAAAPTTAATPAGMMLVPVEPTPEMLRDAQEACGMLAGYGTWPLGKPTHHWVKTSPCPPSCGEHHCHYQLRDEPRKGWWPATYAHEAYGEDQYVEPAAADPITACHTSK